MCGIAGFYGFRNDKLIRRVSKQLYHRGPDGEGYYIDETVTLLNRRLAIIDRAGGDQPIFNEDKTVAIVFNGEIYNYRLLRQELVRHGHTFKTQSDTEVIVHGYERWGEKFFDRLNGMFAFALYDKKYKKLLLVRDHFGIKPLYYTVTKDKNLFFSSEIRPISSSGLVAVKPNIKVLYRYLMYRVHDDGEDTFFEGICRLPPGQMLIIQNGRITKKQYTPLKESLVREYKTSFNPNDITKFRRLLIEAVKLRLISEVPVGSALSGGIDSSAIVAIINKLLTEKNKESRSVGKIQQSFSAVFPGSSNDENIYVDELVSKLSGKINCNKVYPKPKEFFREINEFIATQEEPTISTGPYAQYKVMQAAKKKVTVLLDGQGSDEMMAGYLPYYTVYLKQLFRERSYHNLARELFFSWDILAKFAIDRALYLLGLRKIPDMHACLSEKFKAMNSDASFPFIRDNLKKRLAEDIFYNSLPSLLRYEDKNSMHFSLEGRVPFLDVNLLKFIFSLDDEAIIKDGWNKYILREATTPFLPLRIRLRRNKIGFTTPEYSWFMEKKKEIYQILLSESFASRPYFNQQAVLKQFRLFLQGKYTDTMHFWRIINTELWLREFIDEKKAENVPAQQEKRELSPNRGKQLNIAVETEEYSRFPIHTSVVHKGDAVSSLLYDKTIDSFKKIDKGPPFKKLLDQKWFIVVSEKIIAISQGRSFFIWDIRPGWWATVLSHFVKKTPYGIGLGSPWTMQIAINEAGLPRIVAASAASIIGKMFRLSGVFYRLAGPEVAAIDGPTEYSLYPSNVSAKLGPKNPSQVAQKLTQYFKSKLPPQLKTNFQGIAVIDANDLGQKILGNTTPLPNQKVEKIFSDNPLGQADEQTPFALVIEKK